MVYDAIIVGAGMAGMTSAIYLARAGKSVLVLESGVAGGQIVNTLKIENWPGDYGVSGADLMKKIYHQMNNLGAKLKYERVESVGATEGEDGGFEVKTDEAKYACRAIILAVGTEPRKLSAEQLVSAGKRPISYCATCDGALYGYVIAGEDGRTSQAGVFAAGDCRTKERRQLVTAAGDGANAAGAALDYLNSMV